MDILLFPLMYPLFMSIYWIVGTVYYVACYERKLKRKVDKDIGDMGISFLIPCYNEETTIKDTILNVYNLEFPNKEIIVINDGSSDHSARILEQLAHEIDFKFINLRDNKGKANALNEGINHAKFDYVMVIDADTIIDNDGPYYMIQHFKNDSQLAAVTGNPRIRNKRSLLGKIQAIEYTSMVGGIKRAQSVIGKINTISGVFTLFRKSAVEHVDKWDIDMITEDIAISWKFHLHKYTIKYEPRALCWMLVPETIGDLWKQRIRWAQGGQEVLIRDWKHGLRAINIPLFTLIIEQTLSLIWVYWIVGALCWMILHINFLDIYYLEYQFTLILLPALVLTFINVLQFTVSLLIDSRYEKLNLITFIFLSWYPVFYWLLNALVAIVALPKALRRKKGAFATWTSPERRNEE
ncbi:poly-beta-1,6 N-acetyl-D-glucosamine synthase IcaA [Staphylococcus pettenkoferi]|uniref:poly-beta-1,6 N-acetyl-D-glucosamine synthase IcaA n=1 Tax=Staphylococcus pettenkoferi TaxID=170573 RepID=UPI0011A0B156|nr:poly-beta-1,6 N-acetyl-D-glucosamine synthase IcaA [Staphylococcus pettenkoferi]MCY1567310.1 poly-beta-1,6 N-acetyl-D-glucosamine synthase IcaA [Staphylococcus pettenkoferi]MCY1588346.1 poly-beta-1,6 N-acetyl-D-glucosamine synthase IcaA [Staphylococcus pettenkoferi]